MSKKLPTLARPGLFVGAWLAFCLAFVPNAFAQLSNYTFSSTNSNTYQAITGGTVVATASANSTTATGLGGGQVYGPIAPSGFSFNFNGVVHTQFWISSNGFITFGGAPALANSTPISNVSTTYTGAVSAMGRTLNGFFQAGLTGEIRWEILGSGSNQTVVVQWSNFRISGTLTTAPPPHLLNFQIRLNETGNTINLDYNTAVNSTFTTATVQQVGLRGAANTDYINRTTTTSWSASAAGGANTSGMQLSFSPSVVHPGSTLRYTFAPPAGPTTCAVKTQPADAATGVCPFGAQFRWNTVSDAAGYRIIIDDNADLSSPIINNNLSGQATNYFFWTGAAPSTTYYWNVIAFNGGGDAAGCTSIFSFTTNSSSLSNTAPLSDNFQNACSAGGWIYANQPNNQWIVGNAVANGAGSSLYISSNFGTTARPSNAAVQNSYVYRDVTFPAGFNLSSFSFDWRNPQTVTASDLLVYVGPATLPVPVAGSTTGLTSYTLVTPTALKSSSTWQTLTYTLGAGFLGNCGSASTFRFIFRWNNGTLVDPGLDAAAIDNVTFAASSGTSLSGPYTIDPLGSGPTNFTTLRAAIEALNNSCIPVSGGITFNIPAGVTLTETSPLPPISALGTATSRIRFVKQGAAMAPNPIINITTGTAATNDAIINIRGSQYVSLENLTLRATDGTVEYGVFVQNAGETNFGSQNNRVEGCTITMVTAATNTRGIYQDQIVTATAAGGANHNNQYINNTITACRTGIWIEGAGTPQIRDLGTVVSGNTIGADVADDMGGSSTSEGAGIYVDDQDGAIISGNTVRNVSVTGTARYTGIRVAGIGTTSVFNNRIYRLKNDAHISTTAGLMVGISASTVATLGGDMRVYNNYVGALGSNYTLTSAVTAIHVRGLMVETPVNPGTVSFDNNTVYINNYNTPSSGFTTTRSACYFSTGTQTATINVRGNIFANVAPASTGALASNGLHYGYYLGSTTANGALPTGTVDGNVVFIGNVLDGANVRGFAGDNNGTSSGEQATLVDWKTATSKDANSIDGDPALPAAGPEGYKANGASVNNTLTSLASWVTDDIEGVGRGIPADPGAYEFTPSTVNLAALALSAPGVTGCYQGLQNIVAAFRNASDDPVNFSTNNLLVEVVVTRDGSPVTTLTQTITSGTLAANTSQTANMGSVDMTTAGTYSFLTRVTTAADAAVGDNELTTTRVRVAPTGMPLSPVTFEGFTGANLGVAFPGWSEGDGDAEPNGTASDWLNQIYQGTTMARIQLSGTTDRDWIVGPKVLVTANTEVRFKMAITNSSSTLTTQGFTGSDNFVEIRYSDDCGTTWNSVTGARIDASNWLATVGSPDVRQLSYQVGTLVPALVGREVIFALFATEGTATDVQLINVFLDDIAVRNRPSQDLEIVGLSNPTNLTCGGAATSLQITVRSTGSAAYDFAANPVSLSVAVVDPVSGAATYSTASPISGGGNLASGSTRVLTVANFPMTNEGNYTLTPSITAEAAGADNTNNTGNVEARAIYPVIPSSSLPVGQDFQAFNFTSLVVGNNNWREGSGTAQPLGTTALWTNGTQGTTVAQIAMSNLAARDWIVSPTVSLPATGDFEVRFRWGVSLPATMAASDDEFIVAVSTNCGATWTPIYTVNSANALAEAASGLAPRILSLNAYLGQNVTIGFYASSGTVAQTYNIFLDDVLIGPKPGTDLQAVVFANPTAGCYTATTPVSMRVRNAGTNSVTFSVGNPLSVSATLSGTTSGSFNGSVTSGTLAPNATIDVPMTPAAIMNSDGTYTFNGSLSYTGDGDASNNTLSSTTFTVQSRFLIPAVTTSISNNFSAIAATGAYTQAELTADYGGWLYGGGTIAGLPTTGSSFNRASIGGNIALAAPNIGGAAVSTPAWLIMPKFAATVNSKLTFKLYIAEGATSDPATAAPFNGLQDDDEVRVLVSTDCGNSWTTALLLNAANTTDLTLAGKDYSVNMASFAGQDITVGFYFSDNVLPNASSLAYTIPIDDISLRNVPAVDLSISELLSPVALSCFNGPQTLQLRVRNLGSTVRNFASTPAQFRITVTGPGGSPVTQHNATVNTGTLAVDAAQTVTLTPNLTMAASGTYTLAAQILTADGDAANNSFSITRTKDALATTLQTIDFESYASNMPATYPAWNEGVGQTNPTGTTSTWLADDFANVVANTRGARFTYSGAGNNEWIVSPGFLATSTTRLEFDMALTGSGGTDAPSAVGSDDSFTVLISTDCGATWAPISGQSYLGSNGTLLGIPNVRTSVNVDLSSFSGQTIRIAFRASEGSVSDPETYDIHLDNLYFGNRFTNDLEIQQVVEPFTDLVCRFNNRASVLVRNLGTSSVSSFTVTATPQGVTASPVSATFSGTLAQFATTTVQFPSVDLPTGSTGILFNVVFGADQDLSNNEAVFAINRPVGVNLSAPVATPANACFNAGANLSASGGGVYSWFSQAVGGTALGQGATFTTPAITANTTFYVSRNEVTSAAINTGVAITTTSNNFTTNTGIVFDLNTNTTITGAYVFPTVANASVTFVITNNTGAIITGPLTRTLTNAADQRTLMPINVTLPPGTGYRLVTSGIPTLRRTLSGVVYPFQTPGGNVVITSSWLSGSISTGAYYYFYDLEVELGSACPSVRTAVPVTVVPTGTWTGAVSADWNTAGNWCGGIPTVSSDVMIPAGGNQPQIITGTQNTRNLTMMPGAVLQSNGTLNVAGNLVANGQSIAGDGFIRLNGNAAQTISGSMTVPNLTIANTSVAGVSLAAGANVRLNPVDANSGRLQIAAGSRLDASNGTVALASNAQGTAALGALTGGATYVGQLTQERFISQATSGWYFAGAPFSDATLAQWSETSPRVSPLNNASIFWYQESDSSRTMSNGAIAEQFGWRVPTDLNALINPSATNLRGYRVWLRPNFFSSSIASRITHTGTPITGTVNMAVSRTAGQYDDGGWNLIPNPYPADIDFDNITVPGTMNDAAYVWNRAANQYQVYVKGTGTTGGVAVNAGANPDLIPSGASFFVKCSTSVNLTVNETAKASISRAAYRTGAAENLLRAYLVNQSTNRQDEAAIRFLTEATTAFDLAYDGFKLFASDVNLASIGSDGKRMAINSLPSLTSRTEIPLMVSGAAGTYTLRFAELASFAPGTSFYLQDRLLGTQWLIDESAAGYTFSVTADPATRGSNRLVIVASPAQVTGLVAKATPTLSVWPNPSVGGSVQVALHNLGGQYAQITVTDAVGKKVSMQQVALSNGGQLLHMPTEGWAAGLYTLRAVSASGVLTQTFHVAR